MMETIDRIIEWSEHNDILNQYWYVGVGLAIIIVIAYKIWRWKRDWVV